jgi:hypothetical protein
MKRILLAAAAALAFAAPAFAAPVAYINTPLDTPQAMINQAIANVNAAVPLAATNLAVTGSAGAATLNGVRGLITTESLTTAAGAVFTETLTNASITANSQVYVVVGNGTNAAGSPALTTVTPAAGSVVVKIQNIHASNALNGTLTIAFFVVN